MSAREEILKRIRLSTAPLEGRAPPISVPVPCFASPESVSRTGLFTQMLNRVHGTVTHVTDWNGIPAEAARYLASCSAADALVAAPHPRLESLDWGGMKVCSRVAARDDAASVTVAYAGIAETGTLVMLSGKSSPTTLNFLPEIHIVVLEEARLIDSMEQLWPILESQPRSLNLITGPSKTADIEQTIVYGAHGPRFLHVILITGSPGRD